MARSKTPKFLIGLFITLGVSIGVATIIWVGASKYFEKGSRYVTYFNESVQGLQQDSAVKYRGVAVGRADGLGSSRLVHGSMGRPAAVPGERSERRPRHSGVAGHRRGHVHPRWAATHRMRFARRVDRTRTITGPAIQQPSPDELARPSDARLDLDVRADTSRRRPAVSLSLPFPLGDITVVVHRCRLARHRPSRLRDVSRPPARHQAARRAPCARVIARRCRPASTGTRRR